MTNSREPAVLVLLNRQDGVALEANDKTLQWLLKDAPFAFNFVPMPVILWLKKLS